MKKEEIIEVLEDRFKDRYELEYTNPENYCLILHYPEIKITNSQNGSHTIKDLYVKLYSDGSTRSGISGLRTIVDDREYNVGYSHSHLPSGHIGSWSNFCLGVSELQLILGENLFKTKEELEYLFEILWSYLSWESIEGTPHIKITTISRYYAISGCNLSKDFVDKIPIKLDNIKINLNFKVINTLELEENSVKWVEKNGYNNYIVNKIGYKYYSNDKKELPTERREVLKFKGDYIKLTITKSDDENKAKKCIHPDITKKLSERIQRELKTYLIRSCRLRPEISFRDNNRSLEPNQVSL